MNKLKHSYHFGYDKELISLLSQRTFEHCANFVIPYLKSDMLTLDCGCGPGTITEGFAKRLKQGKVIAVDIKPSQIQLAEKNLKDKGLNNAEYICADILKLPFEDNTFDMAYTNAVVCQSNNYISAIKELYRVTKPQGIIAMREPDFGGKFFYPASEILLDAENYRNNLLKEKGVQIKIGRQLKRICLELGFRDVICSTSSDTYDSKKSLSIVCGYFIKEFENIISEQNNSLSDKKTEEKITQYINAWDWFAKHPHAFLSNAWCQVIAVK